MHRGAIGNSENGNKQRNAQDQNLKQMNVRVKPLINDHLYAKTTWQLDSKDG